MMSLSSFTTESLVSSLNRMPANPHDATVPTAYSAVVMPASLPTLLAPRRTRRPRAPICHLASVGRPDLPRWRSAAGRSGTRTTVARRETPPGACERSVDGSADPLGCGRGPRRGTVASAEAAHDPTGDAGDHRDHADQDEGRQEADDQRPDRPDTGALRRGVGRPASLVPLVVGQGAEQAGQRCTGGRPLLESSPQPRPPAAPVRS